MKKNHQYNTGLNISLSKTKETDVFQVVNKYLFSGLRKVCYILHKLDGKDICSVEKIDFTVFFEN